MDFLNLFEFVEMFGFELKRKILNTPGQGTPTVNDWWGPSHVTSHGGLTGQNRPEAPCRRPVKNGVDLGVLPRVRVRDCSNRDTVASRVVVAPLAIGHRNLAADHEQRRRMVVDGDGLLRHELERNKMLRRSRISP